MNKKVLLDSPGDHPIFAGVGKLVAIIFNKALTDSAVELQDGGSNFAQIEPTTGGIKEGTVMTYDCVINAGLTVVVDTDMTDITVVYED